MKLRIFFIASAFFYFTAMPSLQAQYIPSSFMGVNLIHFPTTEEVGKNNLFFSINHRFANAMATSREFFGMDGGANTQFEFDYGILDRWSAGISRTSSHKTYDVNTKVTLFKNRHVSFSLFGSAAQETDRQTLEYYPSFNFFNTGNPAVDAEMNLRMNTYELTEQDKRSFLAALLASWRITGRISLQASPIYVHKNFVKTNISNDRNGLDLGGRIKITKKIDFIFEGIFTTERDYMGDNYSREDKRSYQDMDNLSGEEINANYLSPSGLAYAYLVNVHYDKPVEYYAVPFSAGVNVDTGGHIFQVFITNSRDLSRTNLLRGADFSYNKKEWTIGFNLNRYFDFTKKKADKTEYNDAEN